MFFNGSVLALLGFLFRPREQPITEKIKTSPLGDFELPRGTVVQWAGNVPPKGWVFCDGRFMQNITDPGHTHRIYPNAHTHSLDDPGHSFAVLRWIEKT